MGRELNKIWGLAGEGWLAGHQKASQGGTSLGTIAYQIGIFWHLTLSVSQNWLHFHMLSPITEIYKKLKSVNQKHVYNLHQKL